MLKRALKSIVFRWERFSQITDEWLSKEYALAFDLARIDQKAVRPLKVCYVKQEVYTNLYCIVDTNNLRSLLDSTAKHTGAIGLLGKFKTDFRIIKIEDDPECNIWKEKVHDCKSNTEEFYYNLIETPFRTNKHGMGKYSVKADAVDWSQYDVVISVDVSVPERITKLYPNVKWCYYVGEPCQSSYQTSKIKPVKGQDVFLTQRMANWHILTPSPKKHVVDFPYDLQYYGCFDPAIDSSISKNREGIFIESHTAFTFTEDQKKQLAKFGTLRFVSPSTVQIIEDLYRSKYFIRLEGRTMWGNAMIEAVAAGCLAIGNPNEFYNRMLFTKKTSVGNFNALLARISQFEKDKNLYENEVRKQRKLLDVFCFYLPMLRLNKTSKYV